MQQSIKRPQKHTNLLSETTEEINEIQHKLKKSKYGPKDDAVKQKFRTCFSKNKEVKIMCKISCVSKKEVLKDLCIGDIVLQACKTGTCDVERTNYFCEPTQIHDAQIKDDFTGSLQQYLSLFLRFSGRLEDVYSQVLFNKIFSTFYNTITSEVQKITIFKNLII